MAEIYIFLSDELLEYLGKKVENPSALIEKLLKQWQKQQENAKLAETCVLIDELELGWESEWEKAAISDWKASGW